MSRSIWNGMLEYDLISLPISLVKTAKDGKPSLALACGKGHRISFRKMCKTCNKNITMNDVQHTIFIKDGKGERSAFLWNAKDMETFKNDSDKLIKVFGLVNLSEIDPIYFKETYVIIPQFTKEAGYLNLKGYLGLRDSLGNSALVCKMAIRSRERPVIIRKYNNYLVATQLWYKNEIAIEHIEELNTTSSTEYNLSQLFKNQIFADWIEKQEDKDSLVLSRAIKMHINKALDKPKKKIKVKL